MTKRSEEQALVIPSGAQITPGDDGFTLGNQGDVVIYGQPALKLNQLFSTSGSVHLHSDAPLSLSRIEAREGEVRLSGALTVQTIRARQVTFTQGSLNVHSIVAEESITLRGESLQTDIIIAPTVEVSNSLKGRATVIESKNERGPTLLKGNFRLEEYLEIFPNGQEIIDSSPDVRARLDGWKDLKLTPRPVTPEPVLEAAEDAPAAISLASDDESTVHEPEGEVLTLTDTVSSRGGSNQWDAPSSRLENGEDERAVVRDDNTEDLYHRLSESFLKIMGSYSDLKLPPPLNTLENLIEERKFDALRKQLTGLWNELLQYHKREGLHIANAVTHNIQEMKKLLQERA